MAEFVPLIGHQCVFLYAISELSIAGKGGTTHLDRPYLVFPASLLLHLRQIACGTFDMSAPFLTSRAVLTNLQSLGCIP
jgi:hypothetical protein